MLNSTDLELLSKNLWYSQLPIPFQQLIQQQAHYQKFERDQAIFRSGDLFNGIYAVLDGRVRLGYIDIEGNEFDVLSACAKFTIKISIGNIR